MTADAVAVPTVDEDILQNFECLRETGELCEVPKLHLTPFVQALPMPPKGNDSVEVAALDPPIDPSDNCKAENPPPEDPDDGCDLYSGEPGANRPADRALQRFAEFPPHQLYEMFVRPMEHLFHPELMQTSTIWGYGNAAGQTFSPGPTLIAKYGNPIVVRIHNNLPAAYPTNEGFGIPQIATHLHNFHTAPESDGGPIMFYDVGNYLDHHYAMFPAGFDQREALGHLWYHDHRADFTSQNVYKGLAGSFLAFDEFDSGNENDPNPLAFRLPSGSNDVPLLVGDKQFDPMTHKLVFDPFNLDGFLGEHVTVNGAVTPFMDVRPRKYRFRIVNSGPSRIYTFQTCMASDTECISDVPATDLILIGNDGNLLGSPVTVDNVTISAAERFDVVIDFAQFKKGDRINLMNIADQTSGKGRTGVFAPMTSDIAQKVMQFRIVGGPVDDPSQIPGAMRDKPTIAGSEIECERTFVFDNQEGGWTINGQLFDFLPRFQVRQGSAERWTIANASRDWEHPIHIHLEEHQFEIRDGATPPDFELMRKDVALLRPGDSITLTMRHRDWLGEYPMHCHNTVHEDHAMLLLWEVVDDAVTCDPFP